MIDGNKTCTIQTMTTTTSAIGTQQKHWTDTQSITGWLDMITGDSKYTTYNAKIQESTHVFVADYIPLNNEIKAEKSRAVIDGQIYDITFIDNPMELNRQLEIYLKKYTGGD